MSRVNRDGATAKERAELQHILADPNSRNHDIKAAQDKLADLQRQEQHRWSA